jgi:hypothetical protein
MRNPDDLPDLYGRKGGQFAARRMTKKARSERAKRLHEPPRLLVKRSEERIEYALNALF